MREDFNIKLLSNSQDISTSPVFLFEFSYYHLKIFQELASFYQIFKNFSFRISPGGKNPYKILSFFEILMTKS